MKTIATWQLPIKTASEANKRSVTKTYTLLNGKKIKRRRAEHWSEAARRRKCQKVVVKAAMRAQPPELFTRLFTRRRDATNPAPCEIQVVVTRISPRMLDVHDNLPMALKGVVDAIAEELTENYVPGRADDAKWIKWEYRQEKGKPREYAVRIEIMGVDNGNDSVFSKTICEN